MFDSLAWRQLRERYLLGLDDEEELDDDELDDDEVRDFWAATGDLAGELPPLPDCDAPGQS